MHKRILFSLVFSLSMLMGGCGTKAPDSLLKIKDKDPKGAPRPATPGKISEKSQGVAQLILLGGRSQQWSLYVSSERARNSQPIRLTSYQLDYLEAEPTPVRDQVVSISQKSFGLRQSIRLVNFTTGRSFPLLHAQSGERFRDLTLSPDGKLAAFVVTRKSDSNCRTHITVLDIDGFSPIRTWGCSSDRDYSQPIFFSDRELAVTTQTDSGSKLIKLQISKSIQSPSTLLELPLGESISGIAIAQDGSGKWVYVHRTGTSSVLKLAVPTTKTGFIVQSLTDKAHSAYEPSWSHDSKKLVYWVETPTEQVVRVLHLATGKTRDISYILVPEESEGNFSYPFLRHRIVCPTFSQRSNAVFFSGNTGNWYQPYRVDLTTGQKILLTDPNLFTSYICPKIAPASWNREAFKSE